MAEKRNRRLGIWLVVVMLVLVVIIFYVTSLRTYDKDPPQAAIDESLRAEDLMFDIKDRLRLDGGAVMAFSGDLRYCTLPFPETRNPFVRANQIWRDANKNPNRGFRPEAGLRIDLEAMGIQGDLELLFRDIRDWASANGFVIKHDGLVSNEGWEVQAIDETDGMRLEAWGRDTQFIIDIHAPCIEANSP